VQDWDDADDSADNSGAAPGGTTATALRDTRLAALTPFLAAVAAIATIAAAGLLWVTSPSWGHDVKTVVRNVGVIPTAPAKKSTAAVITLSPNRIEIPALQAVAPIVPVGTTANNELDVPLDPKIVGWWINGAKPGAKVGSAILDGHINYNGVDGVLSRIGSLNPGDDVYVYGTYNGKQTRLHYKIAGVRTYVKKTLPFAQIFDQHVAGRLVIVTCGGPFDASTGNYLDNIVAYATLA
jgi:hypothetical protein